MSLYLRSCIGHMDFKNIYLRIFVLTLLLFSSLITYAQVTKVSGVVTDARTRQTLPFVNVFAGDSSVNVTADEEGKYVLESKLNKPFNQVKVSYVGYKPATI